MPRQRREKSSTGIYHIILRGIDKRDIFIDDEDRKRFLSYLSKAKEKSDYEIYAYCLMDNHVHILIKEGIEDIGKSIKRITVGYVQFHNMKYQRTGHLFQNRYKSEKVEDDSYFLTVLRYIHQNPLKAGLSYNLDSYEWSSYKYYIEQSNEKLVRVGKAKEYFENQSKFIEFMSTTNTDKCLEYEVKTKYVDEELRNEILKRYQTELNKKLSNQERDNLIKEIKEFTGASNRQLCRVLGIGRGIVERATLREDK